MSRPSRVVLVTFGTRGDVLPFCILGRALQNRGHEVRLVTASDYHTSARRYGLEPVDTGEGFEETLNDPEFEELFRRYFSARLSTLRGLRALRRRLADRLTALMLLSLEEIRQADIVVFNPFAYFAGAYAHESGRPAVRVMCQPLLPSRRASLSLIGGRPLGRVGNRLSYEVFRFFSVMSRRSLKEVRLRRGAGRRLTGFTNPLTANIYDIYHLAAFSPALSPDPGDWPVPVISTGAWHGSADPHAALPDHIDAFLSDGPAPVYVGFGSMFWGAKRNTEVVLRALEIWGGRAILSTGPGGLRLRNWAGLPKNLLATRHADHALLFPRVAAVVHHGGAGTTAAALRAGRPNVVLPLLGDQLYWGSRLAAVGAAEEPIPLRSVTPEDLAGRIARACSDPDLSAAAKGMSLTLAQEHGVEEAADHIEALISRHNVHT